MSLNGGTPTQSGSTSPTQPPPPTAGLDSSASSPSATGSPTTHHVGTLTSPRPTMTQLIRALTILDEEEALEADESQDPAEDSCDSDYSSWSEDRYCCTLHTVSDEAEDKVEGVTNQPQPDDEPDNVIPRDHEYYEPDPANLDIPSTSQGPPSGSEPIPMSPHVPREPVERRWNRRNARLMPNPSLAQQVVRTYWEMHNPPPAGPPVVTPANQDSLQPAQWHRVPLYPPATLFPQNSASVDYTDPNEEEPRTVLRADTTLQKADIS